MMTVEEDKHKLMRHFKDLFDINVPLAKLINVNLESKSSDFRKLLNPNLTLDYIISRTPRPARSFQVNTRPAAFSLSIKNEQDITTPLNYDKGDINVSSSIQYTEQPLELITNDLRFIFNNNAELPNFNNLKKQKPFPYIDMSTNDEATEKRNMKTSITYSTSSINEKEIELLEDTYPTTSKPSLIIKLSDEVRKFNTGGSDQKLTNILDQLDTNRPTTTLPEKGILLTVFTPIIRCSNYTNQDNNDSEKFSINEASSQFSSPTAVDNYNVLSNSSLTLNDTVYAFDFFTSNVSENIGNTVGYKDIVLDSLSKDNQFTTQSTVGLEESTSLDLNEIDIIASTISNTKPASNKSVYSSVESNSTKFLKPKLNENIYQNIDIINNTMRTMTSPMNNDNYIGNSIFSTITISLASSFIFALIVFVIVSLFIIRKHKFQNKVYLSYELGKPRSYSTKPMRPCILTEEMQSSAENNYVHNHFERSKQPIYFDQELGICNLHNNISGSVESCDSGIDNIGFVDCSSEEIKEKASLNDIKTDVSSTKKHGLLPKYTPRKKKVSNVDSRFKVCSSEGNIYYTSPSLTKCLVPPPPYSPRLLNRSCNKTVSINPSDNYSSILPTECSLNKESVSNIMEPCDILLSHSTSAC